jgi:RNA polymerase sigma-70 factor (ECF subfamily)
MESSDADLVARVERGDESSFRVLYRRHTPAMYGVALRLLARRQDAEDAVQEAWLRAVRGLPGFRWESALRTWLVGIAVRCALEVGRRQRPQPPEPDTDLLSAAPSGDLSLDLEAAIAGLADGYRQVLVLHDVEGYTHAEIAALLGVDEGTSKSQLSRARRILRRWLSPRADGVRT